MLRTLRGDRHSHSATRAWRQALHAYPGGDRFASVICGVDWVTGTRTDDDPTNDIVANMSLVHERRLPRGGL